MCRVVSEDDLAEVVQKVERAEANGEIEIPDMLADAPTSVIPPGKEPQAGEIVHRCRTAFLLSSNISNSCPRGRVRMICLTYLHRVALLMQAQLSKAGSNRAGPQQWHEGTAA